MSTPEQDTQGKSSGNTWLIVLIVILGVALVLVLGVFVANLMGKGGETAQQPTVVPPTAAPGVPTVTATDYLNVRSGPGTNYPSYGTVAPGSSAEATGISPDGRWYQVKVPTEIIAAGHAWVSTDYVVAQNTEGLPVVQPPPPPPTIPAPTPEPGVPTVTALTVVNVRSGPGTNYPVYGVAPQGTTLPAIGTSSDGEWYAVQIPTSVAPDGTGWMSAAYVKPENTAGLPVIETPPPPTDVVPPPPAAGEPTAIAFEPINVRSGPTTAYPSYGIAPRGTTFKITGISPDGNWWVVALPTNIAPNGQGWVNGAYVETYNTDNVPVVEPPPLP
jgi:uncharacterized protein YraI